MNKPNRIYKQAASASMRTFMILFPECCTREKCQVHVSVDWASPCLSEADQRGGSGLERFPALPCQRAPALTWRDHRWAWEGSSGPTPLKPLASLLSRIRKKPVLLVMWCAPLSLFSSLHILQNLIEQLANNDCFGHYYVKLGPSQWFIPHF